MTSKGNGQTQDRRHVTDLKDLPRSAALSQLRQAAEAASPPNYPPESIFAPSTLWGWVRNYFAYVFRKKHYFPAHTASPQHSLYELLDENGTETVRVSIAGDWGTGTNEAQCVAHQIKIFNPHYTIHIGDVYYVGDPASINENCLGIKNPNNNYDPVTWPVGIKGSFALNGNHEMYANGVGYFDVFLPRLGIRGPDGQMSGQQTSFFCLQNSYWRIIGIDTGYNSIGVPIFSNIPLIKEIPGVGAGCKLRPELLAWLIGVVKPANDPRGLVVISHHQNYSAFQDNYPIPAQQLWDAGVKRNVLWFWGHEHRLAGYDLYGTCDLKSFGRCVGHGGMPVDLGEPTQNPRPIFYDNRRAANGYGTNGHVNLSFSGRLLRTVYVDLNGSSLIEEEWSVDRTGNVQLNFQRTITQDSNFHSRAS